MQVLLPGVGHGSRDHHFQACYHFLAALTASNLLLFLFVWGFLRAEVPSQTVSHMDGTSVSKLIVS